MIGRVGHFGGGIRFLPTGLIGLWCAGPFLPESCPFGALPNTGQATGQKRGQAAFTRFVHRSPRNPRLTDLIAPLADQSNALAGHIQPCEFNRVASVPADIIEPQIHVQGGVWSARTQFLRDFGFSHRFPFEFCDVDLSRRCLAAGYQLASVPSIVSIAGGVIPDPEQYKYVHDYRPPQAD